MADCGLKMYENLNLRFLEKNMSADDNPPIKINDTDQIEARLKEANIKLNKSKNELDRLIRFSQLFVALVSAWALSDLLGYFTPLPQIITFIIISSFIFVLYFTYLKKYLPLDDDQIQRASAAEINETEQRILAAVDTKIKIELDNTIDSFNILKDSLTSRINDDLISKLDDNMRSRISSEAKTIRLTSEINKTTSELRIRLEGAGGREDRQAARSRSFAYIAAYLGLLLAITRIVLIYYDKNPLLPFLDAFFAKFSLWPYIVSSAAPWIGAFILCEFTALLLLRDSNKCSERQRYFTEAYVELRDRHMALKTIIEYGSSEEIVSSARSMIVYSAHKFEDAKDTETISATSKLIESLTGLIKETTDKFGPK